MADDKWNQAFTLPGGTRRLGFAEYGDPGGSPVFYFHGWPSSRHESRLLDSVCLNMRLRLIAAERPGYGLSDFQKGRTLLDWPRDVCALADHLGLNRFAVLGVSGGGPYAVACASFISTRVTAVLLVSSVAPSDSPDTLEGMVTLNRWLLTFARRAPWLAARLGAVCIRGVWRRGHQVIPPAIEKKLPELDKLALRNAELRETLIASSVEAFRKGPRAAVADGLLYAQPWGFRLEEIRLPVYLWHGESDVVVPPAMGRCLSRLLPNCSATFYPEDGHFSLPFNRQREILAKIPGA